MVRPRLGQDALLGVRRITVVIVDDSAVVRQRLATMLAELDQVGVVAVERNAERGLALVRSLGPDAVVLDIRMPGESGMWLLEKIRQLDISPTVIVLTNYPYAAYRRRCKDLGADYFFDKSTEFHKAVEVLRNGGERSGDGGSQQGL